MASDPVLDARWLRYGTKMGDWLTALPSTVDGTELGDQEWLDALFLCYGIYTPDLPTHCDDCNEKLYICHDLGCKKVGLVMTCPNELYDGVSDLTGKAFSSSHIRDKPLIHQDCAIRERNAHPAGSPPKNPQETK